jgi:hypothetical protein
MPFPIQGKQALDAGHAFVDPVAIPRFLLLGRHLQLALQVLEDAQVARLATLLCRLDIIQL